jgi:hypothetical protein
MNGMSFAGLFSGGPVVYRRRIVQAAVLSLVGVALIVLGGLKSSTQIGAGDFGQYYIASQRLHAGEPVYGLINYARPQPSQIRSDGESDSGGAAVVHEDSFRPANPPPLILVMYPLAFLPYAVAWWLVCLSSLAIVAAMTYRVGREILPLPLERVFWVTVSLISFPMLVHGVLNHVEAFIWVFMVLGWLRLRRGDESGCGIAWGLVGALKLFPLALIPLLFSAGYRRAGVVATGSAFAAFLGAGAILGFDALEVFLREVLPQSTRFRFSLGNISLLALLSRFVPNAVGMMIGALLLLWTVGIARRCCSPDQVFVLGVSSSLLCSPLSWTYYLVLALPCIMIASTWIRRSPHRIVRAGTAGLVALLMFWPWILGGWIQWPLMPIEITVCLNYVPTGGLFVLWLVPQFCASCTAHPVRPAFPKHLS